MSSIIKDMDMENELLIIFKYYLGYRVSFLMNSFSFTKSPFCPVSLCVLIIDYRCQTKTIFYVITCKIKNSAEKVIEILSCLA